MDIKNKFALNDKLTDAFIHFQYGIEHPILSHQKTDQDKINHYLTDHVFNRKVKSMAAGIMQIIIEHEDT